MAPPSWRLWRRLTQILGCAYELVSSAGQGPAVQPRARASVALGEFASRKRDGTQNAASQPRVRDLCCRCPTRRGAAGPQATAR